MLGECLGMHRAFFLGACLAMGHIEPTQFWGTTMVCGPWIATNSEVPLNPHRHRYSRMLDSGAVVRQIQFVPSFESCFRMRFYTLRLTNMEVENGPLDDSSPLQTGGFPLPCDVFVRG